MFLLFYSLYVSMFTGDWQLFQYSDLVAYCLRPLNAIGIFLTSIFGDSQMTNLGDEILTYNGFMHIIALVLATITSIGIVVMAVKGIKRAFSVFFMLYR